VQTLPQQNQDCAAVYSVCGKVVVSGADEYEYCPKVVYAEERDYTPLISSERMSQRTVSADEGGVNWGYHKQDREQRREWCMLLLYQLGTGLLLSAGALSD
jgi:hypothetical protein